MRRGAWRTSRLDIVAVDGVIAARRLVQLGVPESTVYQRCRSGGPWQRPLPGIIVLGTGHLTRDQLVIAALAYAGEDAMVTGLEACRRHGVRRGPDASAEVYLLVPHGRQVQSSAYVLVERTRRLPVAVRRRGVQLAPVARAAVDASRRIRSPKEVTELLSDAVQRGLCSVPDLAAEVEEARHRGAAMGPRGSRCRRSLRRRA